MGDWPPNLHTGDHMICGEHLTNAVGESLAICKRSPHEDEWHEALNVYVNNQTRLIDVQWKVIDDERKV